MRERDREGGKRSGGMCMGVHTCFPKDRIHCFLQILKNFLILKMLRTSAKLIKDDRIVLMCINIIYQEIKNIKMMNSQQIFVLLNAKEINGSKPLPSRRSPST